MENVEQEFIESITQEDPFGCAVASLAFVLGISYQDGLTLFNDGKRRVTGETNFYCPEIVNILKKKGLNYSWEKFTEGHSEVLQKDFVIVFCRKSYQLPFGHFLVTYKNKWMDPWINLPDLKRTSGFREDLPGKITHIVYPI